MKTSRIFRDERRTRGDANVTPLQPIDGASWIWRDGCGELGCAVFPDTRPTPESLARVPQVFLRFRRDFEVAEDAAPLELDVSADERFVVFLDGAEIGRGPNRGLPNRWHCQSWRIEGLASGMHRLEAVCWRVGEHAPLAQLSIRGGFILKASAPYDAALTTGKAGWLVAPLHGTRFTDKGNSTTFGVGSQCEVSGVSFLDEEPAAASWAAATVVRSPIEHSQYGLRAQGWLLFPSPLPDMMLERKSPGAFHENGAPSSHASLAGMRIPPHSTRTFFWDLGDYFCAYPELRVSGGAGSRIRWGWAECLTGPDGKKRDRAAWEGLDMPKAFEDTFLPDGRKAARFTTPWWRAGRWCRITVETAGEPLDIDTIALLETRLPATLEARFEASSGCGRFAIDRIQAVCARALQMCMHEMFFDCPYYEQQMYPGDSRVQYLVATLFGDTGLRAVRNAIGLYDADRRENGQIPMNCPTRGTQESLPFTCCQAMMLGDLAWNHDDRETVRALFPGLVHTLLGMEAMARPDGLLGATPGWNFVDWVGEWKVGVPPDGDGDRPNCEINLEFLHAILSGERCAEALGKTHLAAYFSAEADSLRQAIRSLFWCPDRALFASDTAHTAFSQHAQALALLADVLPSDDARRCFDALVAAGDTRSAESSLTGVNGPSGGPDTKEPDAPEPARDGRGRDSLARPSIYFRHYLFATFFKFHRPDLFFAGLGPWRDCLDWHCSTVPEIPDPDSRSDCHGWGSHPLWHLQTGVAGVRSGAPFFASVIVEPQPAHLRSIRATTPTPHGPVELDLRFDGEGGACGSVTLPAGLSGVFRWRGLDTPLHPGPNEIKL